ncbi:hypothetical protein SKAU_G00376750 [Synaphobranchus kaupii]|uniref:UMA domain-containing protein n=1 Tax=Synaphobranchus kaupii TaxID=118154 RepID=A0A9Q1ECX0_SYNKA|nr:hypothetical protein SKAU_G00376750 [Synaphobranchus kaupii]
MSPRLGLCHSDVTSQPEVITVGVIAYHTQGARRGAEMFSFLRKDSSKKSAPEKEADGFVILGETTEEKRQKVQSVQPATNVIILPYKSSCVRPAPPTVPLQPSLAPPVAAVEAAPFLPELLGDIPFTLAPHVLAMQAGVPQIPDFILARDINDNLASFRYDFTLENSVLCDS